MIAVLFLPLRQRSHRVIRNYFYGEIREGGPAPLPRPGTEHPLQLMVEPLTSRELEVLHLIADGLSNQEIAQRLVITEGTVKQHTTNIYGKLSVQRRTAAVIRAKDLGILP